MNREQPVSLASQPRMVPLDAATALQAASMGVWAWNPEVNLFHGDQRCCELLGIVADGPVSYDLVRHRIHAGDLRLFDTATEHARNTSAGSHYDITCRLVQLPNEPSRWVRLVGRPSQLNGETQWSGVAQDMTATMIDQVGLPPQLVKREGNAGFFRDPITGLLPGPTIFSSASTAEIQAIQQLEASEKRFRRLIEEAPVSTALYVGADYIIEIANDLIISAWGKDSSVIGMPLTLALPELDGQPFIDLLNQVRTTGVAYHATAERADLVVDGQLSTYYFNFTYKPLRNADGEVYAILNMAIDVTEQVIARQELEASEARFRQLSAELDERVQQRTQDLYESNRDLQRSNRNLEQFAYIASHDLQEPLRKIQSFSSIIAQQYSTALGEDGVDLLTRLSSAGARMSLLIQDLLAFSRITTRQAPAVSVSLTKVVADALDNLTVALDESQAEVTVGPLPTVQGDASQLGQLFQNLLGNALKFRRANIRPIITIHASEVMAADLPPHVRPARSAAAYYQIEVADNGIGFDEKYLDRIFQVFQRLHGKNQFSGTGVGLAICEKVAINHGGAITARSLPGQGATFVVYLPILH